MDIDWAYWWIGLVFFVLLNWGAASAQTTAVSGTITDGDSTAWFNARVQVVFVPNPSYPQQNQYNINGTPLTSSAYAGYLDQTVLSNSSGAFNITVLDNNRIAPSGSTWKFIIQSYTSAPSSTFPNLAITGASQNVTAFLAANITVPRFAATAGQYGGAFGYGTNEVAVIPVPGGSFFNVTTGVIDVWSCTSSGCSWQTQAIGSFCSSSTCNITTALYSPNINNICEASQQAGATDFVDAVNKCAAQSYMATGGIITLYGYGNTTQTATTVLNAGTNAAAPITFILNPATKFIFNENLGTATTACIWPLNNGSAIFTPGYQGLTGVLNFNLGPSAVTYDFVCNANQTGGQQAMSIDGLTIQGNASATMAGSLLHIKNIYIETKIQNIATVHPYGQAFTLDNGSDIMLINDNFADTATSGQYPGATVTLNCPERVTFVGGAIQDNGIFNPLLVMNSNNSVSGGCNPSGGGGYQPIGVHFENVDFETVAATVGSFTGHAVNVDPIIVYDPSDVVFNGMEVFGNKGSGQIHLIDVLYGGSTGLVRGPFEVKNLFALAPPWTTSTSLIHNTLPQTAPSLIDVNGVVNGGGTIGIADYRWSGSLSPTANSVDFLDNEYVANLTAGYDAVVPTVYSNINGFCNTSYEGHIAVVTDSTVKAWGSLITGGGTNHVKAYCNGSFWSVDAGGNSSAPTYVVQAITICASGCTVTVTPCTTSGIAWFGGACTVGTLSWPIAFADLNYASTCQLVGNLTGSGAEAGTVLVNSKSTTQLTLYFESATANAISFTEIDCTGVHN